MTFHEPVRLKDFGSRKLLSEHCAKVIADGMGATLAGREATPIDTPPATAQMAPSVAAQ
jgi:1-acyl-sn-glycerol-3-phosphate acyltransferase